MLSLLMQMYVSYITHTLLLTEGTIIVKEPESVTLKCSTEGSPLSNDGYAGMYLYHNFTEQNEVYFNNKIVERPRLKVRIWVNEAFMNYEITIINLTVDDSGVYTCVYKELLDRSVDSTSTEFL